VVAKKFYNASKPSKSNFKTFWNTNDDGEENKKENTSSFRKPCKKVIVGMVNTDRFKSMRATLIFTE